jgi:hypothetical protein
MTNSTRHLTTPPLTAEHRAAARGCCLSVGIALLALGLAVTAVFAQGLAVW